MSPFNVVNGLVVCSITTIGKQLESKDSVFAPYAVPYTPRSHPFVERLIGTIRREFLDQTLFWNANDLERKLADFRQYYNSHRAHTALAGVIPSEMSGEKIRHRTDLGQFGWKSHCRGLYELPVAA